jgi:transposase
VTLRRWHATRVSARLLDKLVKIIDETARRMNRSRAEIIRQAIEYSLDDAEDLRLALDRLQDPADPVLDCEDVKRRLLLPGPLGSDDPAGGWRSEGCAPSIVVRHPRDGLDTRIRLPRTVITAPVSRSRE